MGTEDPPSARVSGFPVLTRLARGSLRHVGLTAHVIPANGSTRPLPVRRRTVRLDGLKTSGSADRAHAGHVGATGVPLVR
ncbi:LmeA family phospholipid-binding protein [Streptomyces tritici]|uniref:LmeA family phospholipid-binding protein n=1 Tax=Streptomyces tritici TaxID=2054410 RepID=UPI003AF0625C